MSNAMHTRPPATTLKLITDLRFNGRYGNEAQDEAAKRRVHERSSAAHLLEFQLTPKPLTDYHEDMGPVTWWCWDDHQWLGEPAYIGTPTDSDWPGYHTHFTPHPPVPSAPTA